MHRNICFAARWRPPGFLHTPYEFMTAPTVKEVLIQGITQDGKAFRPSDWSERLAGVMSQFRPGGAQPGRQIGYSPWCIPKVINEIRCVVVDPALRDHEPMAWDFVMNFAKDNHLVVTEICLLPDAS